MSITRAVGALALAGAGTTAWALYEARYYQLTAQTIPVLPAGAAPLRVLHLSDLHLTPSQRSKIDFVRALADQVHPDLTIATGDFLANAKSVPLVLEALGGLLDRPGAFVLGSNDYYEPGQVNPAAYLLRPSRLRESRAMRPWGDLVSGLRGAGWADLTNAEASVELGPDALRMALRGVDDPHIDRDRYGKVAGPFPAEAQLRVGVTHAPYLRVLDAMVADGAELLIAGHTHGGQICLPGGRAIVTNCDIDPLRASGVSRHRVGQRYAQDTRGGAWLHVSAGLGTAPSAPIRLFCRPRATVVTLVARG